MFEKAIEIIMQEPPELHYPAYYADLLRTKGSEIPNSSETIYRQAAIDLLDEQISICDRALTNPGISMNDEFAVNVEKRSLIAYREKLECLPSAQPEQCEDAVPRASVEYICRKNVVSTNPYEHEYHDKFIQFMDDPEISDFGRWQHSNGFNTALVAVKCDLDKVPSAQPEIIHCCDCIYYDPEHIEKNGVRYEYKDMPKTAFDILGTGLVNSEYGINVGGRCCRDYNVGYSEDKRVFVSKQNYCGRAMRRQDE